MSQDDIKAIWHSCATGVSYRTSMLTTSEKPRTDPMTAFSAGADAGAYVVLRHHIGHPHNRAFPTHQRAIYGYSVELGARILTVCPIPEKDWCPWMPHLITTAFPAACAGRSCAVRTAGVRVKCQSALWHFTLTPTLQGHLRKALYSSYTPDESTWPIG